MTRLHQLLGHIDTSKMGIEVAPYFNPALPKSTFAKVLTLDVFDTTTLKERAAEDPFIQDEKIALIEDVDLVGDASNIGNLVTEKGLAGKIGYIVSSHNFEHLPNPIRFLHGCSEVLEPGGVLSMAVPDARACFDIFRMPTRLAEWLAAYHEARSQPSPETIFDSASNNAMHVGFGVTSPGVALNLANPAKFRLQSDLREAYAAYIQTRQQPGAYRDAHCTVMLPETLELMLRDLHYMGLMDLEIIEISRTHGFEFFVHLRKPLAPGQAIEKAEHLAVRQALLERITANLGSAVYRRGRFLPLPNRVALHTKALFGAIIGRERFAKLSAANRARKARARS